MGKGAERRRQQKDRRIFEYQVQPALEGLREESRSVFRPRHGVIDPIIEQRWEKFSGKVAKLKARLINPKLKDEVSQGTGLDTVDVTIPNGYYVIVGNGAAAAINHTTLRQSGDGRTRLGDHPVMHIGLDDPWKHYYPHG